MENNPSLEKHIEQTWKHLDAIRQLHMPVWKKVVEVVLPLLEDWDDTKRGQRLSPTGDTRPVNVVQIAADGIYGGTLNQTMRWWNLKPTSAKLKKNRAFLLWLQETVEQIYDALNRSNFYSRIRQFIENGIVIGTAAMLAEEDSIHNRVTFTVLHPGEFCIAEDAHGNVDTVYRKYKVTAKSLVERFGYKDLPIRIKEKYDKNPYSDVSVIHAIYPRGDRDVKSLISKNKKWASVWYTSDADPGQKILHEGGYDYFPAAVWRWKTVGQEIYGRSPCMDAYSDFVRLNLMGQDLTQMSQLAADPPLNVPARMKGSENFTPGTQGGYNYYEDPKSVITPVNVGSNYPIAEDREQKIYEVIQQHLKVDFFMMLKQIERQMTAYEVAKRMGEQAIGLSSMLGRMSSEGLEPVLDLMMWLEARAGRLSPVPEGIRPGEPLKYVFLGPLAQAQEVIFKGLNLESAIEAALPIVDRDRRAAMTPKWDKILRELMRAHGTADEMFYAEEEVDAMIAAADEAAAKQNEAADLETRTRAARNAAQSAKMSAAPEVMQAMSQMGSPAFPASPEGAI